MSKSYVRFVLAGVACAFVAVVFLRYWPRSEQAGAKSTAQAHRATPVIRVAHPSGEFIFPGTVGTRDFQLLVVPRSAAIPAGSVLVAFAGYHTEDHCVVLRSTREQARLIFKHDGREDVLAVGPPVGWDGRAFHIRRLGARIEVLADGRRILTGTLPSPPAAGNEKPYDLGMCGYARGALYVPIQKARLQKLAPIRFLDDFQRDQAVGVWQALQGEWEITAITFAERSANPFALRARFHGLATDDDPLLRGRTERRQVGIGINLGVLEGVPKIERITGDGPAARAGLQEGDILVTVNGHRVLEGGQGRVQQLLRRSGIVRLTILRPGEERLRHVRVRRGRFRWGDIQEHIPLPGSQPARAALAVAGKDFWTEYRAEVTARARGAGAVGLAFYVRDALHYHLFRLTGALPSDGRAPEALRPDRLELVRVRGGREHILAARDFELSPETAYRLAVDVAGESITARIDGHTMLTARDAAAVGGKIGLYATHGDGALFDDVRVVSLSHKADGNPVPNPIPVAPPARIRPLLLREDDMERWANPGLEWRRSVSKPSKSKRAGDSQRARDPKLYWQIYPFPGNVTLRLERARYETLTVLLGAGDDDASSGVRFQVERSKHPTGRVSVSLFAHGNALVEPVSVASEDAPRLVFQLDETHARVRAGKRELLPAPLPAGARAGDAVAIAGVLNLDQPAVVRVQADRVLDFRFDRAPDDWHVTSGRWGVMNKWICDPRWSWFGGRSDDAVAAIWSKAVFAGDVTLDIWAALMMTSNDPPYEHPGDFCAVILGDGQRLDSGYSLIVGGGGNFWTKLLRSGQDAGVSFNPAARFPSNKIRLQPKPTLHQRWFHIRLARRGSVVTYALDGREYLRFEDADPLPRGQVGLWTLRNGMLIARARVAYEQLVRRDVPTGGAAPFADETFTNQLGDRPDTRVHKTLDPDADAKGTATYEIRSAQAGGNLAFGLRRSLGDLQREGRIRFDYRIDPGTLVDLKLQTSWGPVRVLLTGPREDDEQIPIIGTVTDAADDGRWRTAELDLYALLQDFFAPRSDAPYFRGGVRITFGAFTSVGYHTAGLGGNAPGASYAIRSFQVLGPAQDAAGRPRLVRTEFPFERPENPNRVIFYLHAPGGIAPQSLYVFVSVSENGRRFDLRHRALRFEHARGRLELDLEGAGLQPADGETITFVLGGMKDRQGKGAPETTVSWTYRRSADNVGPRRVRVWPKPVHLRPVIDLTFDEGPGGALALGGRDTAVIYDQSGLSGRSGRSGGFVRVVNRRDGGRFGVLFRARMDRFDLTRFRRLSFDYAIGPEVPLDLLVDVAGRPRRTHFADGRDDSTIWSRNEQRLGAISNVVTDERWHHADVDLFALLARANPKQKRFVGSQLRLEDTGWKGNTAGQRIALDNIRLDAVMAGRELTGFWIRAADLSGIAAVRTAFDRRPDTTPTGRVDMRPGSSWAEHTPPKLRVPGTTDGDPMGLMMVSQRPDLLPGGPHALTVDESGRVYAFSRVVAAQQSGTPQRIDPSALPDGPAYFHVQVQDAAGNWSDVVHHRVLLDNTPPRVRRTRPADGAKAATDRIEIVFDDLSGVDPGTIVLLVNGQRYQIGDGRLSYRHDTRTLRLNITGGPQAIVSGATYTVTLESADDYVGNRLPAPYTFTFTLDLNQDVTPPAPPRVRLTTFNPTTWQARNDVETELGATNDFEQDLGQWRPVRGCTVKRTADDAAFGRFAVRVDVSPDAERFVVSIRDKYWNLKRHPYIAFDYKLPPGTKLDLWLEVLGNRRRVRLTRQAPNVGAMMDADAPLISGDRGRSVPSEVLPAGGLVTDDTWRRCVIDLRSLVDRAGLRLPLQLPLANKLKLIGTAPSDAALVFDNFEIIPNGWAGARVQWTTPDDESGIRGFSTVWDRTPDTVPPATIRAKAAEREAQVPARHGTWFFHIRCVDGAGNWSAARHVRFDFPD